MSPWNQRDLTRRLLRSASHAGALAPLALLLWDYSQNQLGADPVREITLRTGFTSLVLLLLSLACTPINLLFGWKQVLPLRRRMGLYAFLYVNLHLLTFLWLDYGFDWEFVLTGIGDQRYVLVGFAAFLLLIPLAATSFRWTMRRLGKKWKRLHQLVYVVGILAIIHFFWLVKNVYTRPLLYGSILAFLLVLRIKPVRQRILRGRRALARWWRSGLRVRTAVRSNGRPAAEAD
ncbi:MAG: sulfite oxidase heme-binding subunit YedZ [Anaerolineae bacterium]